jgi:hypothetical protein
MVARRQDFTYICRPITRGWGLYTVLKNPQNFRTISKSIRAAANATHLSSKIFQNNQVPSAASLMDLEIVRQFCGFFGTV